MNLNHKAPKIVTKPWGTETWHMLSDDFCVKTIRLFKGSKTSYQWHREKEEVNFIRSGEAEVWMENELGEVKNYLMKAGDSFFVPATRKHRVIALTDLEMFEVSNKFVDDVVRINDEFGRGDGRITVEHQVPAVLIFAAGLGSRLKHHTVSKNKALLPLGNKAVISHIIEKFPLEYDIVVAVGYQKDSLMDYCKLAHPERKMFFVEVDQWDDPHTDPGHSVMACRHLLQRPFYLTAVDSLIEGTVPHLDGNWIGAYPTDYPEKYATIKIEAGHITAVADKASTGFEDAFIGLAAILDYQIFWNQLNKGGNKLMTGWQNPVEYPTLKAKRLKWLDTGNLDDLEAARTHFKDELLSSYKTIDETIYRVGNRVLKFHPDLTVSHNRFIRGEILKNFAPANLQTLGHFIAYDWQEGQNLYHCSPAIQKRFLLFLQNAISSFYHIDPVILRNFYREKTDARISLFTSRYGVSYLSTPRTINGIAYPPLHTLVDQALADNTLGLGPGYRTFHGDLHFDNVIYDGTQNRFVYIDWRESFAGQVDGGDLYYDLGKLYAGTLVPFELLKNDANVTLSEGSTAVTYCYETPENLLEFKHEYENWLAENDYSLRRVKLVAALALLNIAPLHSDIWNKVLLFKGIELLYASIR